MRENLFFTLLIISISVLSQSPGGVSNNCVFWVKADDLMLVENENVTLWNDISGQGNNATQNNILNQPTYTTVLQNYNPSVYFNEDDQFLNMNNLINANATNINIFAVGTNEISNSNEYNAMVFGQGESQWSSGGYCLCTMNSDQTRFGFWVNELYFNSSTTWFGGPAMQSRLLEGRYDSTELSFFMNAQNYGNTPYTGIIGNSNSGNGTTHLGGGDHAGNSHKGHISEVIIYDTALSNADRDRINSYLAIKYAITLSRAGVSNNIVNSNGQSLFTANTNEYWQWNGIIGIGRDDTSDLYQKQSHVFSDNTRIYVNSIANDNSSNLGTFGNNQFVIMGRNNGIISPLTNLPSTEVPPTVITRIEREYKITNTNFTNTFNIDIQLNDCIDITQVNINDIRLLVDDDGDFTNATVYNTGDDGLILELENNYIKILNISNTHINNNTTAYITIASTTLESLSIVLVANDIDDIIVCDDISNDGFEEFQIDINDLENQIIGTQTDIDSVEFFDENGNLLNLTNPYTNITQNIQTITAAITHDAGCYAETTFNLIVQQPSYIDTQIDLFGCDELVLPEILGNNLSGTEAYYTETNQGGTMYNEGDIIYFNDFNSYPVTIYIADTLNTVCYTETSFELTLERSPEINGFNNVEICATYTLPLITGTNLTGNEAYYTEPNGEGISYLPGDILNFEDFQSYPITLYIFDERGIDPNTCIDEELFEITIYNSVDFELSEENLDINLIGTIVVNMTDDSVNYEYAVDGLNFQTDNTFINLTEGIHTLIVKDENGCVIKTIDFEIEIIYRIIPKFFTPNGDGINDTWIVTDNLGNMTNIYIFDRFGKVITKILPNTNGWDGMYAGKPAYATGYWYLIEFDDGNILRGNFSLIRR